jgi:hypothetical protein
MRAARGLVLAFALFAASFALHVVGGATGQRWLFAIAVALIFVTAGGFPAIALLLSGTVHRSREWRYALAIGAGAGWVLTMAALWAANGRAYAWWQGPAAIVMVWATSVVLGMGLRTIAGVRGGGRAPAQRRTG